jgi:hypothetical protein
MVLHPGQFTFAPRHSSPPLPPEALMQIVAARVNLDLEHNARMEALLRGDLNWPAIMA